VIGRRRVSSAAASPDAIAVVLADEVLAVRVV
jgi:hypothetical protein